jgi:hypothetical protein
MYSPPSPHVSVGGCGAGGIEQVREYFVTLVIWNNDQNKLNPEIIITNRLERAFTHSTPK